MRIIGIRPRRKQTANGEARPTQVLIFRCDAVGKPLEGKPTKYDLADQQAEIDFVLGRYPTAWTTFPRGPFPKGGESMPPAWTDIKLPSQEVMDATPAYHFKWRRAGVDEDLSSIPAAFVRRSKSSIQVLNQIPLTYDGLSSGDRVAMILGGSGDSFAGALASQGRKVGGEVFRIPPVVLKQERERRGYGRDDDAKLLAELFAENPDQFFRVDMQDQVSILVRECYRARTDAMKARIACEQRMQDLLEQRAFRDLDPTRTLQLQFDEARTNDQILKTLVVAEDQRNAELLRALKQLPVYTRVVELVEGLGPSIGARLVAEVMDIRRFEVRPDVARMNESYAKSNHFKQMGRFQEDRRQVTVPKEGNGSLEFRELQTLSRLKRQQNKHAEADYLDKAIAEHELRAKLRKAARERSAAKLTAYMGAHVLSDGTFPRRRRGALSNWSPDGRQGLFLFGEQLNYRPNSEWGKYMLRMKAEQRRFHPEELTVSTSLVGLFRAIERYFGGGFNIRLVPAENAIRTREELLLFLERGQNELLRLSKLDEAATAKIQSFRDEIERTTVEKKVVQLYTPAHILRMAVWRTLTRFMVDFYHKWERLDRQTRREEPMSAAAE